MSHLQSLIRVLPNGDLVVFPEKESEREKERKKERKKERWKERKKERKKKQFSQDAHLYHG